MSEIKDNGYKVRIAENEYNIAFTINVIDQVQDYFDIHIRDLKTLIEVGNENIIRNIRIIIKLLINEQIDINRKSGSNEEVLVDKDMEMIVNSGNIADCWLAINRTYLASFLIKKDDEDNEPEDISEKFNVVRMITIGRMLGYKENEIWHMTPKKIMILHEDYLEYNGLKEREKSLDEVFGL